MNNKGKNPRNRDIVNFNNRDLNFMHRKKEEKNRHRAIQILQLQKMNSPKENKFSSIFSIKKQASTQPKI